MHPRLLVRISLLALLFAALPVRFVMADQASFTIHIKDYVFRPGALHVHVGDKITYINDDDDAHTVTADDKSFDSKGIDSHDQWSHVFVKPGKFTYFCSLHPYVHGEVDVDPK